MILNAILTFISLFNLNTPQGVEHLTCKWTLLICLAVLVACYYIGKKFHWSIGLCFAYIGCYSAYIFQYPITKYFGEGYVTRLLINNFSAVSLIATFSVIAIVGFFDLNKLKKMRWFFEIITIINSLVVCYQYAKGNAFAQRGGLFDNVSVNTCLIGACYPLLLDKFMKKASFDNLKISIFYFLSLLISFFAILISESSVGIGVLAVGMASYFHFQSKNKYLKYFITTIIFVCVISIGYITNQGRLLNDSGRFPVYELQYNQWKKQSNILTGYGPGTYMYFGVKNQIISKYNPKTKTSSASAFFLWLHNDWLQLLLESGIIGMILILNMTFFILKMSWNIPELASCFVAFLSSMVFDYPIHYPIHALFAAWLVALIILKYKENRNEV